MFQALDNKKSILFIGYIAILLIIAKNHLNFSQHSVKYYVVL